MAATSTLALVPLRAPGAGKTRLAQAMPAADRAILAAAMLADVAAALAASSIERVVVAAGGAAAVDVARDLGLEVVADRPDTPDLDAAVAAALERVGQPDRVLVVAADLPRLTADHVAAVLDADAEVVVAPTHDGGTGGLLRTPPTVIATSYGPGSAQRHLAAARQAGVRAATVHTPGFDADVDTVEDLAALRGHAVGVATSRWLARAHVDLGRVTG